MMNGEEGFAVPSPRVRSSAASESCDSRAAGIAFSEMSESECDMNSPEQWRRRKVKFLCSFGGNILPRPFDNKLRYVGGETRIVRVSRDISFSELVIKMSEFYDQPFTIKYQLPEEEDLDALVSVFSDDDLANMMEEYDKLEAADGFTRLRVFLFSASEQFDVASVCVEADVDQRFVDALNGLPESASSSDIWKQHTEFLRRNESCSSFNCLGSENGLNPRRILRDFPVQQDTILVASPPLSPLRQPSSPFEESSDHYRQEHQQLWTLGRQPPSLFEDSSDHYRQEHQQSWTLGNYLRTQDSAPSMATAAGRPFQEAPMPSEAVLGYHKYKHSVKVFPSNEVYYTGSPEFESPRDINRMEVANHWPEDNHKHPIPVADIVPHQVNVHQHHLSQQQPPQHQQQNVHPAHQPTVGYCPPEFFQNSEVSSPQRKIAMQPVKYCRLFEPSEQNEAQYLAPEVYEGERSWHVPHQPLSLPVTADFANAKVPPVKLGSQNMAVGCRIGEGLGRNVLHHVPSASELDRFSDSQKHAQGVWQYESRLDYGSTQSSSHYEPANSIANHTIHLSCGRNVNQQHCQLSGTGENVGLIGQNFGQIHGRFERNSVFENPYERQFACDTRSSIMHTEHPSYYQDQCGSSKLECQVHNTQSVTNEGLLMRTASAKVDLLPPSIDKVQTDICYRDRVDKARAWVLHNTNYQRDTIHMPYAAEPSGVLTTEEGTYRDASQNSYAEHDSRWLNPKVVYHDPSSADLYKHANCDQYDLSAHVPRNLQHTIINNQLDSDLVVHLGSTGEQSQWCYSSGDERSQEFACAQRNAENMEMVEQSNGSSDKSAVDVHNFAGVHITDDLLQKERANTPGYEENQPKEFNQDSGPEITKEIQGDHPVTVSSHYQMQRQLGGLIDQVSVAVVNSKSSVTIANTACSHIMTSSKVFLPNSLTLQLPNEILSSTLPSSGPPIYDRSPVNSTNIAGPNDLLSETEREGQINESENPELKTIGKGHLKENIVSNMEVARNENLLKDAPEICLKDRPEKDASGKSRNLKSAEQSSILAASTTISTTKVVGTEPLASSTREGDSKEVDQKALPTASSTKDDPPEEKPSEENALRLEDLCNGSMNKANNIELGPEADNLAQGLQTIRNDDLEEIRELGSGTYGTVYYGKWKGSDVAIKRIKASCFADRASELIADFWKEARILGQLHHPNVVAFYGVVRDGPDGTLATITEYMVNGSLKQVLHRKDRTIDRRKRLIIARDAAFGMEYLHEKKIVHFDLKCDNLLVNMKDPHRPICKIGDLGLSKIKHQTLVSGGVRGTLPWMAPELLSEEKGMVTEKVDVYSFGIVMWELLTGEEPYANMHFGEIIGGIMNNTLRPTIPDWCREPAWRSLMEKCWSFDPAQRPSFSEIATELRAMGESMNIK